MSRWNHYTTIVRLLVGSPFFLKTARLHVAEPFARSILNIAHEFLRCIMCANIKQSRECLILLRIPLPESQRDPLRCKIALRFLENLFPGRLPSFNFVGHFVENWAESSRHTDETTSFTPKRRQFPLAHRMGEGRGEGSSSLRAL